MRQRSLGSGDLLIPEIGLGTSQLGNVDGQTGIGKPISRARGMAILQGAFEQGVRLFDTADGYGDAETLLGDLPGSVKRQAIIATKAGLRDDGARDFSESYVRSRIERSLRRLKVDVLELFQLNKPAAAELADGTLFNLLARLRDEGLIRRAGMVVGTPEAGLMAVRSGVISCVQVMYNLVVHEAEPVIAEAAAAGVGVLVRSPLNSGLLSGTYSVSTSFPAYDERSAFFVGETFRRRLEALEAIVAELAIPPSSLVEQALNFCLSNPGVSAILPGTADENQLRRYLTCADMPRFDADQMNRIREVVARHMADLSGNVQFLGAVPMASGST